VDEHFDGDREFEIVELEPHRAAAPDGLIIFRGGSGGGSGGFHHIGSGGSGGIIHRMGSGGSGT
jgi:hypothetical protein